MAPKPPKLRAQSPPTFPFLLPHRPPRAAPPPRFYHICYRIRISPMRFATPPSRRPCSYWIPPPVHRVRRFGDGHFYIDSIGPPTAVQSRGWSNTALRVHLPHSEAQGPVPLNRSQDTQSLNPQSSPPMRLPAAVEREASVRPRSTEQASRPARAASVCPAGQGGGPASRRPPAGCSPVPLCACGAACCAAVPSWHQTARQQPAACLLSCSREAAAQATS
ncbi:hypothetical protein BS78_K319200 [Paspalum vaginatum]|uniref:Uncharacterized protein n=1 Tax=Paspalum vaginatum TaxID=158149 RepID=A0A9W7XDV5_9POAL|nr:hypothetical protein BS78_K319200 [Paspalum vaginatum]